MQHILRVHLTCPDGGHALIDTRYNPNTCEILLTSAHVTDENNKFDWRRPLSWFWGDEGAKSIEKKLQVVVCDLNKNCNCGD